jgi:hypothetical protein
MPHSASVSASARPPFCAKLPFIAAQRAQIAELCRRFHVRRLDLFGAAARGTDFDPNGLI